MQDPELRLGLLGGFTLAVGEHAASEGAWRVRKAKSVVKLLALSPEHRLHRERVCELLWPDRDREAASNNLHQALYVARRALDTAAVGASAWLALRDDSLVLDAESIWIDAEAYEAAAAGARAAGSLDSYAAALGLYRGELLPDDRYEEWTVAPRRALHELHLAVLLELAELHLAAGDRGAATEALHQAVLHDPLDEEAHRRLITLYAELSERADDVPAFSNMLLNAGNLELDAGEPRRAVVLLAKAARSMDAQRLGRSAGWVRAALAEALQAEGNGEQAAQFRIRARESFEAHGDTRGLAAVDAITPAVEPRLGGG